MYKNSFADYVLTTTTTTSGTCILSVELKSLEHMEPGSAVVTKMMLVYSYYSNWFNMTQKVKGFIVKD